MKIVAGLWDPDVDALLSKSFREHVRDLAVTRLQLNLDDADIPDSVLRLQAFDEPLTCVVSLWCEDAGPQEEVSPVEALAPLAERLAAWEVTERLPLPPSDQPSGKRLDGLSQVAFLRKPDELAYDEWLAHWHGPHTQVAIETQATFGYVQNRVLRPLTDATPPIDAIVEELFPSAAMHDIHAFYGSDGDQDELDRRLTRLMESVATMGADRDLDVVPTSRYVWRL